MYHDNRFIPPTFTDENVMALKYVAALMSLVIEKQRLTRKLDAFEKNTDPLLSGSSLEKDHNETVGQDSKTDAIINRPKIESNAEIAKTQIKTVLRLKEVERNHILETLQITGWKIRGTGGAAELLDIHPSTLYSRMKKLGIRKKS
ncbi:MAG: hypothetical protein MUP70_04425, partial [Candidatus Aminicenantes bacterium]|nr:hypothetical protein [Candidatus Aminicenantes bacterium]